MASSSKVTSRFRQFTKWTFRLSVVTIGVAAYATYDARHPPEQFPVDPKKKTIAILGSGWAATSFLKDLDTENFNVVIVSPRNYFLFTPLLPSCTVGTIELRSIMQPIRHLTRFKKREVKFVEGNCTKIDPINKCLVIEDNSEIVGKVSTQTVSYDYLVVACGAENATFGVPGVKEHACFLKEAWDARKIRTRLMDCIESAAFPGQPEDEIKRLLHMVVVGGGPTGVEYAAELHDFLVEDLLDWYPDLAGKVKITLVEALPTVLPMFSRSLIEYTEKHFTDSNVNLLKNTAVKKVEKDYIEVQGKGKAEKEVIPYGLLVWATGNTPRGVVSELIKGLPPTEQNQRRGLVVDDYLRVKGSDSIFALGDASATRWAPTAQVASGQGRYLAHFFNSLGTNSLNQDEEVLLPSPTSTNKVTGGGGGLPLLTTSASEVQLAARRQKLESLVGPFSYDHLGSLAYIGSDKAIADLPGGFKSSGMFTHLVWRSAYLNNLFAFRNRALVMFDWMKKTIFGRDISRE